jgi:phosphoglycerate-specific signal transduction histidine kinase
MKTKGFIRKLNSQNAVYQSALAIVLMSIIPLLCATYMGLIMQGLVEPPPSYQLGVIFSLVTVLAIGGFIIFLKFPKNIVKLRSYISNVADGVLPQNVSLIDSESSNDLRFIENGLNSVIQQMHAKLEDAELQNHLERELREKIELQQNNLVQAEKHRAMVQSLSAACHHIGEPTTALGMRLAIIQRMDLTPEEQKHVDECDKNLQSIIDVLDRLRTVSEFRTEPYIYSDSSDESEMLAV